MGMNDHVAVLRSVRDYMVENVADVPIEWILAIDETAATCEADAEIREILFGELDRDRDNTTTRGLVVVAVNSLFWRKKELAAEKAKHAALADSHANLLARLGELEGRWRYLASLILNPNDRIHLNFADDLARVIEEPTKEKPA